MLEMFKNYEEIIAKTIDINENIKNIDVLMNKIRVHINKLDPKCIRIKENLTFSIRLVE